MLSGWWLTLFCVPMTIICLLETEEKRVRHRPENIFDHRTMSHSLLCTNDNNLFVGDILLWCDSVVFPSTSRISEAFVLPVESSWQSCRLFWWCEGNRFLFSLHAFRPQQHVNVCVSGHLTVCDVLSMGVSRKLSEMAAHPSITAKQRRINTHTHLHSCTENSNISTATRLHSTKDGWSRATWSSCSCWTHHCRGNLGALHPAQLLFLQPVGHLQGSH